METNTINQDITEEIIIKKDNNEDRTSAFITTKKKHKKDSIGWLIGSLILFFLTVLSIGRFTPIGQFLDDVIFNFIFGWFKYPAYLLLIVLDISIYAGIRFKFKKRFIFMIVFATLWIMTFVSLVFMTISLATGRNPELTGLWQNDILKQWLSIYSLDWFNESIFSGTNHNTLIDWFVNGSGYMNLNAGGGIFGAFLAGTFAYLSIPGAFVLWAVLGTGLITWILTGDPFYFVKPKNKRYGKGLRILALKNKDIKVTTSKQLPKPTDSKSNSHWNSMNVFSNEESLDSEIEDADFTVSMPSYVKSSNSAISKEDINIAQYDKEVKFNKDNKETIAQDNKDKSFAFVSRRHRSDNQKNISSETFDLPSVNKQETKYGYVPESTKYGNISVEEAREKFNKEMNVASPFKAHANVELEEETLEVTKPYVEEVEETIEETIESNEDKTLEEVFEQYVEQDNTIGNIDFLDDIDNLDETVFEETINEDVSLGSDDYEETVVEIEPEPEPVVVKPYVLPSIDLLNEIPHDYQKELKNKENAALKALAINETFLQFDVKAKVVNTIIGPSVTKFEIQAEHGTKVGMITKLENDLKLALATQNIRLETPIPGKTLIGIEIGNPTGEMVSMREIIQSIPKEKDNKLLFVLGKNVLGEPLTAELNRMPHLLVAGSTGSGKSVMINALICSILLRAKPTEVKFLMIDPKKVELSVYSKVPHMLTPVISDMSHAAKALQMIVLEMERRYELFSDRGAKNIEVYNRLVTGGKKLPFIVVIIDELADLMMTAGKKDVEESIMRITQMARAAGIHLIAATQRPSVDVITGTIKTNIPTRIAFAVTTGIDSRTILDSIGAENLLGSGDMLFAPPGSSDLIRAQGAYLSDDEIFNIVNYCASQDKPKYEDSYSKEQLNSPTSSNGAKDPLYDEVRSLVIFEQRVSASLIQRKFNVGYNRALNIIDQLEAEGVVGQQNGTKPREVYIKK